MKQRPSSAFFPKSSNTFGPHGVINTSSVVTGHPVSLFTGILAMARTIGRVPQWNEMISDLEQKIGLPHQLFIGSPPQNVKPIEQRG